MGILFSPANPPQLSFKASDAEGCPDARPSPPASYCPATNTIVVDLAGAGSDGRPIRQHGRRSLASGDNTAYSVLVSRYMQAIQHARGGVVLDNAEAALRTACLTGVATVKMSKTVTTPDGNTIALTAGDVDEAVSGILTNGLAASDVNGESVPSGFSRIDAFRVGVLGDEDRCFKRFPDSYRDSTLDAAKVRSDFAKTRSRLARCELDLLGHAVPRRDRVGHIRRPGQERVRADERLAHAAVDLDTESVDHDPRACRP